MSSECCSDFARNKVFFRASDFKFLHLLMSKSLFRCILPISISRLLKSDAMRVVLMGRSNILHRVVCVHLHTSPVRPGVVMKSPTKIYWRGNISAWGPR